MTTSATECKSDEDLKDRVTRAPCHWTSTTPGWGRGGEMGTGQYQGPCSPQGDFIQTQDLEPAPLCSQERRRVDMGSLPIPAYCSDEKLRLGDQHCVLCAWSRRDLPTAFPGFESPDIQCGVGRCLGGGTGSQDSHHQTQAGASKSS